MSETCELTKQQAELIAISLDNGAVLVTAPGCANDVLWGELSDLGLMEPADAPAGLEFLHAWQFTKAGRAHFQASGAPS